MPIHPERVSRLERIADKHTGQISDVRKDVAVVKEQMSGSRDDISELKKEVGRLRFALITAAITVALSSLLLSFSIYQTFGG